mmetsp:Transcript_152234/g.369701  ORF Transcript_152234/g.369701 Transcript_152234/m.369701 type:complete len:226 (-) Transcript_152234:121-798(-)
MRARTSTAFCTRCTRRTSSWSTAGRTGTGTRSCSRRTTESRPSMSRTRTRKRLLQAGSSGTTKSSHSSRQSGRVRTQASRTGQSSNTRTTGSAGSRSTSLCSSRSRHSVRVPRLPARTPTWPHALAPWHPSARSTWAPAVTQPLILTLRRTVNGRIGWTVNTHTHRRASHVRLPISYLARKPGEESFHWWSPRAPNITLRRRSPEQELLGGDVACTSFIFLTRCE